MKSEDHWNRFLASLASSAIAEVVSFPMDTAKVRLQVQKSNIKDNKIFVQSPIEKYKMRTYHSFKGGLK